ncbi:hypothetical protein SDC9_204284 [bioreactor metagenome]|uniref:Uncharacterized protein n=1 Tax=bioreactor metagenome TaxID=1076179 RepID=A0A645J802_9ZZZZ
MRQQGDLVLHLGQFYSHQEDLKHQQPDDDQKEKVLRRLNPHQRRDKDNNPRKDAEHQKQNGKHNPINRIGYIHMGMTDLPDDINNRKHRDHDQKNTQIQAHLTTFFLNHWMISMDMLIRIIKATDFPMVK